ncbi:arylesterase [Kaistia algarum]|uniref:arylesterase n=1 Tax=Kaistia algarum TaxID=2083279 RepID=UPI000CE7574F|nr:arylesterase [Kaistia algarum]MCX5514472.1 arylesterase [Kaistia algarum]PPE79201.1 arylesterase [Kaistia algarum]
MIKAPALLSLLLVVAAFAVTTVPARAAAVRIVALGDSLTAGYGLGPGEGFTDQLQAAVKSWGQDVEIVNAGVSGDTAAGGLARLDWSLGEGADAVIVELGANDMLRGFDPAETRAALGSILKQLKAKKLPVLLVGMRAAPNLGPDYAARFEPIYEQLAEQYGAMLYPFFLDGVAGQPALLQADGLHPNRAGVAVIVKRIFPAVERLIAEIPH